MSTRGGRGVASVPAAEQALAPDGARAPLQELAPEKGAYIEDDGVVLGGRQV